MALRFQDKDEAEETAGLIQNKWFKYAGMLLMIYCAYSFGTWIFNVTPVVSDRAGVWLVVGIFTISLFVGIKARRLESRTRTKEIDGKVSGIEASLKVVTEKLTAIEKDLGSDRNRL